MGAKVSVVAVLASLGSFVCDKLRVHLLFRVNVDFVTSVACFSVESNFTNSWFCCRFSRVQTEHDWGPASGLLPVPAAAPGPTGPHPPAPPGRPSRPRPLFPRPTAPLPVPPLPALRAQPRCLPDVPAAPSTTAAAHPSAARPPRPSRPAPRAPADASASSSPSARGPSRHRAHTDGHVPSRGHHQVRHLGSVSSRDK